jgi:hypothetical protein
MTRSRLRVVAHCFGANGMSARHARGVGHQLTQQCEPFGEPPRR